MPHWQWQKQAGFSCEQHSAARNLPRLHFNGKLDNGLDIKPECNVVLNKVLLSLILKTRKQYRQMNDFDPQYLRVNPESLLRSVPCSVEMTCWIISYLVRITPRNVHPFAARDPRSHKTGVVRVDSF